MERLKREFVVRSLYAIGTVISAATVYDAYNSHVYNPPEGSPHKRSMELTREMEQLGKELGDEGIVKTKGLLFPTQFITEPENPKMKQYWKLDKESEEVSHQIVEAEGPILSRVRALGLTLGLITTPALAFSIFIGRPSRNSVQEPQNTTAI